jgi:transcriptional regulator of NAD metabolism
MSNDFELPNEVETKGMPKKDVATSESGDTENDQPEKPQFTEAELAKIFDEIIFSGEYSEQVTIKGKLHVTLKTRTAEESEEITRKLDSTGANLISTLNEKRALLNVYYALTGYQGKDMSTSKREDREKFINRLPSPIIGAIVNALSKFDRKVYAACKDGEENF